jgi:Bacterial protein of unknown function (DUF899)
MKDESTILDEPAVVDRATFQAELDKLRSREKAHTREGDAISAARRRLPMVEVATRQASKSGPTSTSRDSLGAPFLPGLPANCTPPVPAATRAACLHVRIATIMRPHRIHVWSL